MDESRLKDVPLFGGMSKQDRRSLASCTDEIDVREGKELCREGSFAYEFFVIVDGSAEVTKGGESLTVLGPGDFFGEIGALDQVTRVATVTATSAMELIVMTSQAIRTMSRDQPDLTQRLRDAIAQRLPATNASELTS